jgi:proteasome accessory factor C
VPAEVRQRAVTAGTFTPAPDDRLVTLELDPPARWVADYYPCEEIAERSDGGVVVKLRSRDDAWLRRVALGVAGFGRVTDPPEVAADVRDAASRALAGYAATGPTD